MRLAECGKRWRAMRILIPEKQWPLEAAPCKGETQGLVLLLCALLDSCEPRPGRTVPALVDLPQLPGNRFRATDALSLPAGSPRWPHLPVGR